MGKVVQLSLTDKEYENLEQRAGKEGVSVPFYIKSIILEDTEFQKWFKDLLSRVAQIPKGDFNLKSVFGIADWSSIPKGVRLALGRAFYNHVVANKIPDVIATEKDSANTQWYRKES